MEKKEIRSTEEARELLQRLEQFYKEPVLPLDSVCDAIEVWMKCIEENNTDPALRRHGGEQGYGYFKFLNHMRIDIRRSNLLGRLLYAKEPLRTRFPAPFCPTIWSRVPPMRVARLFPFLLLLHVSPLGHGQELPASSRSQPLLSKIALTAEENEIYGAFLDFRLSLNKEVINLSDRTFPIDLSGPDQQSCLKGLELINLAEARKRFHLLSAEVSNGRAVRRVDATRDEAKVGLLSLSEIAFDKRHQFAVLQFRFSSPLCCQGGTGMTVVHAGTIVFEKLGDEWKQTERGCPSWFS